MQIFPQMKRPLENHLVKMKFGSIMNACKVTTTKEKDFDENMLVVQIQIQKYGMRNVLLDGGFGMNIASKGLWKKLGLRKPQLAPFGVCMVDYGRCNQLVQFNI